MTYSYSRTSSDPQADADRLTERLRKEMERLVQGAGHVVDAQAYEPAKGGGWIVVFDTEYAALKVYYTYRKSSGVKLDKSSKGWSVSTRL